MTTPSESTLRRHADRLGLRLSRSDDRLVGIPQGWQLSDASFNCLVFGGQWGVSLDEIADEIAEYESRTSSPR